MIENNPNISINEQRIREITYAYYSNPEIRKIMFEFSKNRESVPRYFEGFGKRPDSFQYDSDIFEFVKKGATSFHCSQELWSDPLEISTDLKPNDLNELRIGWDLILDVDSPYLEYSKIYAQLLVDTLKKHQIEHIGCKFSGSKGLHIIVPWKAFPEEIYGQKTKDMFPEFPRIICSYLSEILNKRFAEKILEENNLEQIAKLTRKNKKDLIENKCKVCNRDTEKQYMVTWVCPLCKSEITIHEKNKRIPKCPECRREMNEKLRIPMQYCVFCAINSIKNPELFEKERIKTENFTVADLILVSPRHLFRMPYSLHEKTALASVVINPSKIMEFEISDAKPFKFKPLNFLPDSTPGEAKTLLLSALNWKEQKENKEKLDKKKYERVSGFVETQNPLSSNKLSNSKYKEIIITSFNKENFPPCIKLILEGIKDDGRKRALFLLLNFFKSIKMSEKEIEKQINEWNSKNSDPLKLGYIQAQLAWYKKNPIRLPPNCDKPNYKDLNVCKPDELCKKIKNPVNYFIKKYLRKNNI